MNPVEPRVALIAGLKSGRGDDQTTGHIGPPVGSDGTVGCVDVRLTLKTDDGAYIYVEYGGRADMANGLIVTAPTFQTGDERYAWLNKIQAVGAGSLGEDGVLTYSLYEVVLSAA